MFVLDGHDARSLRRIRGLRSIGLRVTPFAFMRSRGSAGAGAPKDLIVLGTTYDGRYLQRVAALARSLAVVWRHRRHLATTQAFYAINFDNLALALFARWLGDVRRPIVVEVADIQPVMWTDGWQGILLRAIERVLLRRVDLLVTTSAGFVREYLGPRQRYGGEHFLWENKIFPEPAPSSAPDRIAPPVEHEPWVIGYVGAFRCRRSWDMVRGIARDLGGRVEVRISGFPMFMAEQDFVREAEAAEHVHYDGRYGYPDGLADAYAGLHLSWGFDFSDPDGNSRWLLPNRLYESGAAAVPILSLAGTETGHWVTARSAGWTLEEDVEQHVKDFVRALTPAAWRAVRDPLADVPAADFRGRQDYERFATRLRAMTGAGLEAAAS